MFFFQFRYKIAEKLTFLATNLTHILLRKRKLIYQWEEYAKMPDQSLGYIFYCKLKAQNLSFKPNLIRHDLKHILLDYDMGLKQELQLHSFLMGNGSANIMGTIYTVVCLCILPKYYHSLKKHYWKGKQTIPLNKLDLQQYAQLDLQEVRLMILSSKFQVSTY